MFARTVIFVLCLAVCGTYGCSRLLVSPERGKKTHTAPPPAEQIEAAISRPEPAPVPNPSLQARIEQQDIKEEDLFASITDPPAQAIPERQQDIQEVDLFPPLTRAPAQAAPERQQDIQEDDLFAPITPSSVGPPKVEVAKGAPKSESKSKSVTVLDEAPTALQKTRGPRADDRLLDLLEKDLDRAVVQPVERRRLEFSKAVREHPRVLYFVKDFSKTQSAYFARSLARSGKYFPMIATVLREEGLPEELAYLALIESNFDPQASSPSDAVGLWQFIPVTARQYGLTINSWIDERRDPVKSTRAAAAYLKDLHAYFGRWYLATAAYNAGQGAINRALQRSGAHDFWSLSEKAKLSDETRNFVPKFIAASLIASNPRKYGFANVPYEAPLMYEEVEVRGNLQLALAAEMAGTDFGTIQELNPELLKSYTPPGESGFRLKIPAGYADTFARAYHEHLDTRPVEVVTHEVRKGDTLYAIARRYGQELRSLMRLNGLTSSHIRVGQRLRVILQGFGGQPR